jgi:Xaa-Pro aminopeptidase
LSSDARSQEPSFFRRAEAVRRTLPEAGLDALLVTHPPNLRYLTGFDGSLGALLLTASGSTLIVDGRYITVSRDRVSSSAELRWVSVTLASRSLEEAIAETISGAQVRAIGVEAAVMTLSRFELLTALLGAKPGEQTPAIRLVPSERAVERARIVKDPGEIDTFRRAAAMLSVVAERALAAVEPGRTELDVAADIDALIRSVGFSRPAFETIVASGPNSALPHAHPGPRRLAAGDSVVLDFGGVYDGYCVDLTRTVQLAPGTDAFVQVFEAVRAAHEAAIAAVRPGVRASLVDSAARQTLAARGLGDAFVHGTGHGLGLEVHEEPRITKVGSAALDEVLQPGMVFTVEPGAYLAGALGIRIEDDVVVTSEGCEVLTRVPIDPVGYGRPAARAGAAGGRGPAGD